MKKLLAPLVVLIALSIACQTVTSAEPSESTDRATATDAPQPTRTPAPTVDFAATEQAETEAFVRRAVAPDLDLAGFNTATGALAWVQNEEYEMVNTTPGTFLYQALERGFIVSDFVLSVDITWDSKTGVAGCGIIFRAEDVDNGEQAQFNAIRLSGFPGWDIELWNFGDYQANMTGDVRTSAAINQESGSTNHYVLVANGTNVTVYANGTRLGSTTLKASMVDGELGILAWQESGETTCTFNNLWVWDLTGTSTTNPAAGDSGEILFEDDFSSVSSGWDRYSDEDGETEYLDGGYHISVVPDYSSFWANPGLHFTDVSVEVDAYKIGGVEDNEFGIICRYQDTSNFYTANISSDGYYGFVSLIDGEFGYVDDDAMRPSDLINLGEELNHLRLDCVGDTLTLYINGELAGSVTDDTFSSGDVGLYAGTFSVPETDIFFDNFVVYQP